MVVWRKLLDSQEFLVVCDDVSRVLYFHCGWPGSVHDNRVWRNCNLYRNAHAHFSDGEYLLTDSAFLASQNVVPAFKSVPGLALQSNKRGFNTLLSRPRVKSEHCIGLLKGRFAWLKGIRIHIKRKRHVRQIIRYVTAALILHNLLIAAPFMDDLFIETFIPLDDDDELNQAVHPNQERPGQERRNQLLAYFGDENIGNIN